MVAVDHIGMFVGNRFVFVFMPVALFGTKRVLVVFVQLMIIVRLVMLIVMHMMVAVNDLFVRMFNLYRIRIRINPPGQHHGSRRDDAQNEKRMRQTEG